jgi:uncharacterized protein (TIGR02118 family)
MIAAVWRLRGDLGTDGVTAVSRAVSDQGLYARGRPFDAFVVAPDETPREWIVGLGGAVWAWRADEHVPRSGPPGCAVAMVSLMRRSPAMDHGEFAQHWIERHAPLALRRHVGLADYRQYVVTETLTADTPEIDGVARLAFVTRTDFDERFFDSDEGRAEIMADVARFMARPGSETTLVGPPGPPGTAG